MYDMYPEWGPSRHRRAPPDSSGAVQTGLDLRDNGGQRPTTTRVRCMTAAPRRPARRHPRRRHRSGGDRRGPQGARRGRRRRAESSSSPPATTSVPSGTSRPARCCPTPCSPRSVSTTRSCSARWAAGPGTRTSRRPPGAGAAAAAALRARPLRQPATLPDLPGAPSPLADPGEVDFVVVREGTEGPYVGNGGVLRVGTPHEIATEVSINTAFGVERVVRDAFARAQKRPAEADAGPQDQRAHARRRRVVAAGRRRRRRSSPTSASTTCTSTRPRSSWSTTRRAST